VSGVEVCRQGGAGARGRTVVRLQGEHDVSSRGALHDALGSVRGDVLLDLSECSFIDASVIGVVVERAIDGLRDGHRLEVRVAAVPSIVNRVLDAVGMRDYVRVESMISDDARN
jgi:anti-anti-sigma factor